MRTSPKSFPLTGPRNAKEPQGLYSRQHAAWRRAYAEAGSLRSRFPGVALLSFQLDFEDARGVGHYSAQMRELRPGAQALLAFACPRTLCLNGGFDLDALVAAMITKGKATASGTMMCKGHMQPGEGAQALATPCAVQLKYRFTARHEAPADEPASERAGTPDGNPEAARVPTKPARRARRLSAHSG